MGSQSHGRPPLSAAELAAVAVGEQPEDDGLLACLECGLWYRGLGGHLVGAHDMTADEYRELHELPRRRGLWAEDARRGAGERARQRASRYPKAVKTRLTGDRAQVELAVAAGRESWQRAGTRAVMRAHWVRLGKQKRQRIQDKYEFLARSAGYGGIDDLIEQLKDESSVVLAETLGVSVSGAKWVRRLHASRFNLDHHPPAPDPLPAAELNQLKPGDQPMTETHVLCRVCGQWLRGLARHVTAKHDMNVDGYRRRYSIAIDVPLVPAAVSRANNQARAERQDRLAREHGFDGRDDLIAKTRDWPVRNVAALLDVTPTAIYSWRRRSTSTGG